MTNTKLRTPYMVVQEKLKEKEIEDTKKYINEVWGKETPIRDLTYKEIKKLGEELGMNIFNTKSFNDAYAKGQKRLKNYTRVCKYCDKYYDIKVRKKSRPRGPGVCLICKSKNSKKRNEERKIKTKKKWERLILDLLERKKCKMSILEISKEIGCSGYSIRLAYGPLAQRGKIKVFKKEGLTTSVFLKFINKGP